MSGFGMSGFGGAGSQLQLADAERSYYDQLFLAADADRDGKISGADAQFFRKSGLPPPSLKQVWTMADSARQGFLGRSEFYTAMRLIYLSQQGARPEQLSVDAARSAQVRSLPRFEGIPTPPLPQPAPSGSPGFGPSSAPFPAQPAPMFPSAPGAGAGPAIPPIQPQERSTYENQFHMLDSDQDGFITGEQARDFFGKSNLPPKVLAQVWKLSDVDKDRRLNRDEFCIALHLVQTKQKNPHSGDLPDVLPAHLLPPSSAPQSAPANHPMGFGGPSPQPAPGNQPMGFGGPSPQSAPGNQPMGFGGPSPQSAPGNQPMGFGGPSPQSKLTGLTGVAPLTNQPGGAVNVELRSEVSKHQALLAQRNNEIDKLKQDRSKFEKIALETQLETAKKRIADGETELAKVREDWEKNHSEMMRIQTEYTEMSSKLQQLNTEREQLLSGIAEQQPQLDYFRNIHSMLLLERNKAEESATEARNEFQRIEDGVGNVVKTAEGQDQKIKKPCPEKEQIQQLIAVASQFFEYCKAQRAQIDADLEQHGPPPSADEQDPIELFTTASTFTPAPAPVAPPPPPRPDAFAYQQTQPQYQADPFGASGFAAPPPAHDPWGAPPAHQAADPFSQQPQGFGQAPQGFGQAPQGYGQADPWQFS